ncbi:hypothetical protein BACFRA24663_21100 [Bacteroides fragilis]
MVYFVDGKIFLWFPQENFYYNQNFTDYLRVKIH